MGTASSTIFGGGLAVTDGSGYNARVRGNLLARTTQTIHLSEEVLDLYRFGALLHGMTVKEYLAGPVAEWVRASNLHQLSQPLRLLQEGPLRSTPSAPAKPPQPK